MRLATYGNSFVPEPPSHDDLFFFREPDVPPVASLRHPQMGIHEHIPTRSYSDSPALHSEQLPSAGPSRKKSKAAAAMLNNHQRVRVSCGQSPITRETTVLLDAASYGPEGNRVSIHLLRDMNIDAQIGSQIELMIEASEKGPIDQGLTYREKFVVWDRKGSDLLLGRHWIENRWDDATFYTLKGGKKNGKCTRLFNNLVTYHPFANSPVCNRSSNSK